MSQNFCPCCLIKKIPKKDINKNFNHKSKFSFEDDQKLKDLIAQNLNWEQISLQMGKYTSRQCKERWELHLNPFINHGPWTSEEDQILIKTFQLIGSKWSTISQLLPNRTDMSVKNRWRLLNRLKNKKIDLNLKTFEDVFPNNPKFLLENSKEFFHYVTGDEKNLLSNQCDFFGSC